MPRYRVASRADLMPNTMIRVEVEGKELLVANVDGAFYAVDGRCSHMGGQLWKGRLDGYTVRCPRHGAQYDLRSGEVVGQVRIPLIGKATALTTYTVLAEGDDILIEL